jgi:hypothetical protein
MLGSVVTFRHSLSFDELDEVGDVEGDSTLTASVRVALRLKLDEVVEMKLAELLSFSSVEWFLTGAAPEVPRVFDARKVLWFCHG